MPPRDYYLPSRRLVSQDEAALIESARVPRSRFTGSWSRKTTFDAGYLVPFLVDEILPGDHMSYNVTAYVRLSTPLFPMFDNQRIDTFFFFVPNRLLWDNWERFMGAQDDPGDSIAFTIPQCVSPAGGYASGSIFDHFGLPVEDQSPGIGLVSHNALPLRAYNLIFNSWFRDQNLVAAMVKNMDNGPDAEADFFLHRRAKSHDYFTSALPWAQKFTAPTAPLGGLAPVLGIGYGVANAPAGPSGTVKESGGDSLAYPFYDSAANFIIRLDPSVATFPQIYADLSSASGVPINTLRTAFMVQTLLERDARGGTRYVELIKSHFGVTSPDFRLQRPEYIGGGQTPLQITPIAQTAPTTGLTVGALGAAGTGAGQHRASFAATEHGYIIGLINVRTELSYQQGLHKLWSRLTRNDIYWPAFAQLGEQAILNKEIYVVGDGVPGQDDLVFGYQERWHEYRTHTSEVTGFFKSGIPGTLDPWHLAQRHDTVPLLNDSFIADDPPMARVLAAGELALLMHYLADLHIQRTAVRPIPTYGTPATLGRF